MDNMDQLDIVTSFFEKHTDLYDPILDLYKALTCYRMYESFEEFMAINPEIESEREAMKALWDEFDSLSERDLAEIAIDLLKDIKRHNL